MSKMVRYGATSGRCRDVVRRSKLETSFEESAATSALIQSVTLQVEEVELCESMLKILDAWPALATSHRAHIEKTLAHMRSGGRVTMSVKQGMRRLHGYLMGCKSKGVEPGERSQRTRPRAKYQRAPIADFLSDPSKLPKLPPGRRA